jgi:hypothetical protein
LRVRLRGLLAPEPEPAALADRVRSAEALFAVDLRGAALFATRPFVVGEAAGVRLAPFVAGGELEAEAPLPDLRPERLRRFCCGLLR